MDNTTADRTQVADTVRAELARKRLRQADLAAELGMSQPALSRRLTGARPFRVDELQHAARFLGVTPAALLEGPAAVPAP